MQANLSNMLDLYIDDSVGPDIKLVEGPLSPHSPDSFRN